MTRVLEAEADRLVREAAVAQAEGDTARASDLLHQALRHEPTNLLAATRLAEIEIARKDPVAATARLQQVLHREPNFAPALTALAHACWMAGSPADGLVHARRAVEIQPPNPKLRMALIQLCVWLGCEQEARAHLGILRRLAGGDPSLHAQVLGLKAELHIAKGEARKADRLIRKALNLAPDWPELRARHGMNLLRLGDFAAGWPAYEARDQVSFFRSAGPAMVSGQLWSGEDLHGRTILIQDEQGNGDAIQFFRYLPLLHRARPARIIHSTFSSLTRLFAAAAPFAEVVTTLPAGLSPDFHCHSSRLPQVFDTRLDTIPNTVPYLSAPTGRLKAHLRLPRRSGLRVGLVWSGDPRLLRDHRRSIPAAQFLKLVDVPSIDFQSLQKVIRPQDLPALEARPQIGRIVELCADFADTAAVIRQLDLVIAVDTAVAHLAGAMGKPVWILLGRASDWRWMTDRDDSPWYPTARLFRSRGNDWNPMLQAVKRVLSVAARAPDTREMTHVALAHRASRTDTIGA